jgi:hypothetical protein
MRKLQVLLIIASIIISFLLFSFVFYGDIENRVDLNEEVLLPMASIFIYRLAENLIKYYKYFFILHLAVNLILISLVVVKQSNKR